MGVRSILLAVGTCGGVSVLVENEKLRVLRMTDLILPASELSKTMCIAIFFSML